MAQGDSIVGICNAALIALGEDVITSLNDPTKAATLCSIKYDQVRRELLASHTWGCAKAQAQLAAATAVPLFKWQNAFPLPADFIRLWDVEDMTWQDETTWEILNGYLYTDQDAPLDLTYVKDQQDPTKFDPLFAKALARALATDLAEPLTQSAEKEQKVEGKFNDALSSAKLVDSQSDGPRELDEDVWLRSRY